MDEPESPIKKEDQGDPNQEQEQEQPPENVSEY